MSRINTFKVNGKLSTFSLSNNFWPCKQHSIIHSTTHSISMYVTFTYMLVYFDGKCRQHIAYMNQIYCNSRWVVKLYDPIQPFFSLLNLSANHRFLPKSWCRFKRSTVALLSRQTTLPETNATLKANREPEKIPLEKEKHLQATNFGVPCFL